MIEDIIGDVLSTQKEMAIFKASVLEQIDDYIELMRQEYNLEMVKGKKGNMSFESFDGLKKITISVQDAISFDEKLVFAKEKIDEFLTEETRDASPAIQTLINGAFDVDKKGNVSASKILALRSYDIENPLWQEAMQIIEDSIEVTQSKSYLRFYTKERLGDGWQQIVTDPSKI